MNRSLLTWAKLTRAALLVVLVTAQSLAMAHEVTHWDQPAQELCATCSLSSHLDAPLTHEDRFQAIPEQDFSNRTPARKLVADEVRIPYFQRAPPVSL